MAPARFLPFALLTLTALLSACGTSDRPLPSPAQQAGQTVVDAGSPAVTVTRGPSLQALAVDGVTQVAGEIVAFGPGAAQYSPVPTLPAGVKYVEVAAGTWHVVALRSDGQVVAWGDLASGNAEGQLAVPALPAGVTYTAVAAGGTHSVALRSDGQVVTWGDQSYGLPPVPALPAGTRYTAVAAGVDFNLALRSDGQVVAWLTNNPGYYSVAELQVPALPAGMTYTGIKVLAPSTAVAYRSDGNIMMWGQAYYTAHPGSTLRSDLDGSPYLQVATSHPYSRWEYLALLSRDGRVRTTLTRGNTRFDMEPEVADERVPGLPAGTSYVEVTSGGSMGGGFPQSTGSADGAFMALRNDGGLAVWGTATDVAVPALGEGQRYTAITVGGKAPDALIFLAIRQETGQAGTPPDALPHPAPTAPGKPVFAGAQTVGNLSDAYSGGFKFTFAASEDETKVKLPVYRFVVTNQKGETFYEPPSTIYTSATTRSLISFKSPPQMEGTWRVQVQASHQEVEHWSALSDFADTAVKYDFTAPSAPVASVSGTKVGDWYKDSAQVSFGASTDPLLADGSVPSGNVMYQGAQTYTASGTFTYSGTAKDAVGNTSKPTTGTVRVDATAPQVTLSCPATAAQGSAASATWTATDAESGLQGPASGTLTINTAVPGEQTLTAQARDQVGHEGQGSCTVVVTAGQEPGPTPPPAPTYPFDGFRHPVRNPPFLNTHRAGSTIQMSFTLGGNKGLQVLAPGYPKVSQSDCQGNVLPGGISMTADSAVGLRYNGHRYIYMWRTAKSMQGCWVFNLKLNDGSEHLAFFRLR